MEKIKIKDAISRGDIKYKVGDKVFLIRRKNNGYPKTLDYNIPYDIKYIENDFVVLKTPSKNIPFGVNTTISIVKIHKSYVSPLHYIREDIISKILD